MAHIDLGVDEAQYPGINGPLAYRPETAKPLGELAEVLLRAPHSMSAGERELIAAYVSGLNECNFCCSSHSAFAAAQLDEGMSLVDKVRADLDSAPVTPKLRALLRIAGAVQAGGRNVTADMVEAARGEGATDVEIHDTHVQPVRRRPRHPRPRRLLPLRRSRAADHPPGLPRPRLNRGHVSLKRGHVVLERSEPPVAYRIGCQRAVRSAGGVSRGRRRSCRRRRSAPGR